MLLKGTHFCCRHIWFVGSDPFFFRPIRWYNGYLGAFQQTRHISILLQACYRTCRVVGYQQHLQELHFDHRRRLICRRFASHRVQQPLVTSSWEDSSPTCLALFCRRTSSSLTASHRSSQPKAQFCQHCHQYGSTKKSV